MVSKSFLSIILAFALVSLSLAKSVGPLDHSDNVIVKDGDGKDVSLTGKEFILFFAITSFRDLSQDFVHGAANISIHLLKDKDLKSATSPTIKEFYQNITEFMEEYKELDELEELFNLVEMFEATTSHYIEMAPGSGTPDMLTIQAKLKQFDADDLEQEMEDDFEEFAKRFLMKLNDYLSKQPKDATYRKLMEWSEKLKQTPDTDDKVDAFAEFFEMFSEST